MSNTLAARIERLEAELTLLKAECTELTLLKAECTEQEKWPKQGDVCWFIGDDSIQGFPWTGASDVQLSRLEMGNVYRTRDEARAHVERHKVMVELKQLADRAWGSKELNWSDEGDLQEKYGIHFDHSEGTWETSIVELFQTPGEVYFPSEESAVIAINTIGEERMKLLLG